MQNRMSDNQVITTVINRHGKCVPVDLDTIRARLQDLSTNEKYGKPLTHVNIIKISSEVILSLHNNMHTKNIDSVSSELCQNYCTKSSDYSELATRLIISNMHKSISSSLESAVDMLHQHAEDKSTIRIDKKLIDKIRTHTDLINQKLMPDNDYTMSYNGLDLLMKKYLPKAVNAKKETLHMTPQHFYMLIALSLNDDINTCMSLYDAMSNQLISHATPIMMNSWTNINQCSSCFLLGASDDMASLLETVTEVGLLSKHTGGIGVHLSSMRSNGAGIKSSGGKSKGIKPYLKVLNTVQQFCDQGGNRPGSFAMYIEPWHADIFDVLSTAQSTGMANDNASDLKYALFVSDLFMKLTKQELAGKDVVWYLMCPAESPGLHLVYGAEFETLYYKYVSEGKYKKIVKPSDVFKAAHVLWKLRGVPYVLFKDHINNKSNMNNVAVINSSNLCVVGKTLLLTDKGHFPIKSLMNKTVNVWNGFEWSEVMVRQTNACSEVMAIEFSNMATITCTAKHKFFIDANGKCITKQADELTVNDVVVKHRDPFVVCHKNADVCVTKIKAFYDYNDKNSAMIKSWNGIDWECVETDSDNKHIMIIFDDEHRNEKYVTCDVGCRFVIRSFLSQHYDISLEMAGCLRVGDIITNIYDHTICLPKKPDVSVEVKKIIWMCKGNKYKSTYCATEPKRHSLVFNGILTGNCSEIIIPSWSSHEAVDYKQEANAGETGVCTLGAVALAKMITSAKTVDYKKIQDNTRLLVRSLNHVIDNQYYVSENSKRSATRHRPIGIGMLGLADLLAQIKIAYNSHEAVKIARSMMANMYYAALDESCNMAMVTSPYSTFTKGEHNTNSPLSNGELQFDMWVKSGHATYDEIYDTEGVSKNDWNKLRKKIQSHGVANAYLIALMPTSATSTVIGQNECFEPFTSNIYTRNSSHGEFYVINKHLMSELSELGLCTDELINALMVNEGSVQLTNKHESVNKVLVNIPADVRNRYLTAREMTQHVDIINISKAMAPFVCQTISMNCYVEKVTLKDTLRFLITAHDAGLKTGMYYLHSQPAAQSQQTSKVRLFDNKQLDSLHNTTTLEPNMCSIINKDDCVSCQV